MTSYISLEYIIRTRNTTLRFYDLILILLLAVCWYGLVPLAGALVSRHTWRVFRRRFDNLRLKPFLDYASYPQGPAPQGVYRFMGGFESTDGFVLWIRSKTLTVPVILKGAQTYIVPMREWGTPLDRAEAPEQIRWNQVAALTEGAKVFVGGALVQQEERWVFVTTAENPLMIIFYDGKDRALLSRTIGAGRHKNEYWNPLTPYSFIAGAFSQLMVILHFLPRPIFRFTVITAGMALLSPLLPLVPPGIGFTWIYQRLWRRARLFRAYRDLLRLPLKYMTSSTWECRLPGGERYGAVYYDSLSLEILEKHQIPLLIPGRRELKRKPEGWYVFGRLSGGIFPQEPADPFAPFGAVSGNPETRAKGYTQKAYLLEITAGILLLAGIGLNIFCILRILLRFFS